MARPLLAWTLALVLAGSACAGGEEATEPTPTPPGGAPTATPASPGPVQGGTVVVAISADPGHLNPAITTSGATHTASELFYNGLLSRDEAGEPVPDLAERWEVQEDGSVYVFHLHDGITWHDGMPFTSADVKFTFEEVLLPFHARTKASVEGALESIETPDDLTVIFRFRHPYEPFLRQLDATEAPIVAKHIYEGTDPLENPANARPVGTGAFRFVSYTPESEIRLERNPSYFKEGLPYLDEVIMRVIPDSATQVLALENGEVDFLWSVPGPDLARFQTGEGFTLAETGYNPGGSNCIMTVSFNLERPILQDARVRRAIAHAVDQQAYLDQIQFGQGRVAAAPISSRITWAHAQGIELPAHDPEEAARLLDEAGWTDGGGTRTARGVERVDDGTALAIDFLHFPQFAQYGELFRQQMSAVGIDVQLVPLDPPVFAPTVFEERNFDTNVISYCNGPDPEIGVRRMYDSAQIGPVPFTNAAAYGNEEVDALFAEAVRSGDATERGELYRQIQEIVVGDLPYFWLVETTSTRAWTARCQGFQAWTGLFAETAWCSPA